MGLDGFSMGNLGLTELTSAQMSNQAEQMAQKDSQIMIKSISETEKDGIVKRKKEEEEEEKEHPFEDGFTETNDADEEAEEEDGEKPDEKSVNKTAAREIDFDSNNIKNFSLRLNSATNRVELLNKIDNKVLEDIKPEELMYIISKLDSASGVLINRKI